MHTNNKFPHVPPPIKKISKPPSSRLTVNKERNADNKANNKIENISKEKEQIKENKSVKTTKNIFDEDSIRNEANKSKSNEKAFNISNLFINNLKENNSFDEYLRFTSPR